MTAEAEKRTVKHTPGPWTVEYEPTVGRYLIDSRHRTVADVDVVGVSSEAEADARFIAAAPELYEACRQALHDLEYVADGDKGNPMSLDVTLSRLRDALAKAEGAEDD